MSDLIGLTDDEEDLLIEIKKSKKKKISLLNKRELHKDELEELFLK